MKIKYFFNKHALKFAFLLSIIYWLYLAINTQMIVEYDAISYESLGSMLAHQGWIEFFKTGPHREPFYPLLIAFSMKLGGLCGFSYFYAQVVVQLFILFLTQLLTLCILRVLKIGNLACALAILYLGISPALVNSALSLYSEIATYPFILAGVIFIYKSRVSFVGAKKSVAAWAIASGVLFVALTLNKTIFELITPIFILLFMVSIILTKNRKIIGNAVLWLFIFSFVFYGLISGYKLMNKVFNGSFVIADRGPRVIYGNTAVRMIPLNKEKLLTTLASVAGEGVCKSIFGEQACRYWSCWNCDGAGSQKVVELKKRNLSDAQISDELVALTKMEVLKNPVQYALLGVIEGGKMLFWESSQVGFVVYPAWLVGIFNWLPFRYGLRLASFLLIVFSFIFLIKYFWQKREAALKEEGPFLFIYLCLVFIFSFVGAYSISCIIVRYTFPIVPLYIILITFVGQNLYFLSQKHKTNTLK